LKLGPSLAPFRQGMQANCYSSKQEALEAIKLHTGKDCETAVE